MSPYYEVMELKHHSKLMQGGEALPLVDIYDRRLGDAR
jgi:hypothetical protein